MLYGGKSSYFELKESDNFALDESALFDTLDAGDYDLLIICNPNNPTSALIGRESIDRIVSHCGKKNTLVMIDCENSTAIPLTDKYQNLVVLRGVSKFFASPGLRLGYAVTSNRSLSLGLKGIQVPWSVNSLAEVAGLLMFGDVKFIKDTKAYIEAERNRMYARLLHLPKLKVYKPTANFILCKIIDGPVTAADLFDTAIREKLMIRDCASFTFLDESYFRFCFMKSDDDDKLMDVIERLFT